MEKYPSILNLIKKILTQEVKNKVFCYEDEIVVYFRKNNFAKIKINKKNELGEKNEKRKIYFKS